MKVPVFVLVIIKCVTQHESDSVFDNVFSGDLYIAQYSDQLNLLLHHFGNTSGVKWDLTAGTGTCPSG